MSRSIGKPLAHDAFQRPRGALIVIYAKLHAVAIARVKFRKMSVQMLLAAMLALTMHSAFEDREKAFGGIGVSVTAQPPVTGQHRAVTALHDRRSGPHRQPVVFLGHADEARDQSRRPLALGDEPATTLDPDHDFLAQHRRLI
jgi:hypothetical protein